MASQYDHLRGKNTDAKKHPDRRMPPMKEGSPQEEAAESPAKERKEKKLGLD